MFGAARVSEGLSVQACRACSEGVVLGTVLIVGGSSNGILVSVEGRKLWVSCGVGTLC